MISESQDAGIAEIIASLINPKVVIEKFSSDYAFELVKSFISQRGLSLTIGSKKSFEKKWRDEPHIRSMVAQLSLIEEQTVMIKSNIDKLESFINEMFNKNKTITFTSSGVNAYYSGDTNQPIEIGNLSSGEKQLLRILLEGLSIGSNILIIDEPELSMHIDWQEKLVLTLRELNPSAQLIFASHSPDIMANIETEHIFKV